MVSPRQDTLGTGSIALKMTGGFMSGFVNGALAGAGRMAVDMLEDAGRDAILSAVGVGPLRQIVRGAFQYIDRMDNAIQRQHRQEIRIQEKEDRILQAQYRLEHKIWLEQNRWRFDWRSQPRRPAGTSAGGEWMPGRLDYQVGVKQVISRKQRRERNRALQAYRQRQRDFGQTRLRTITTSWGSFHDGN